MERRNCYIVGVDIKGLIPINEISREAGDMAIITALSRLDKAAGEEDLVFRIGGDEFNGKDGSFVILFKYWINKDKILWFSEVVSQ